MSIMNPTKATVKAAMKNHAEMLAAKAARLAAFAESFDEMTEEQFMDQLGSKYGGAGYVRNLQEEMAKASEVRPSDLFQFNHALTEVFVKAQRESAVAESAKEA